MQINLLSGVILAAAKFSAIFFGPIFKFDPKNGGKFDVLLARLVKFDERNGYTFDAAFLFSAVNFMIHAYLPTA